jgi:hypothetical protein
VALRRYSPGAQFLKTMTLSPVRHHHRCTPWEKEKP